MGEIRNSSKTKVDNSIKIVHCFDHLKISGGDPSTLWLNFSISVWVRKFNMFAGLA